MTDALFLAQLSAAVPGSEVVVSGDEGRHAAAAKRMRAGESVLLSDGAGSGVRGEVTQVTKSSITVRVGELIEQPAEPLQIVAVQALAKGERSAIAIEVLTEMGAAEILAWQASRSVVRWDTKTDKGLAKWRATALAATKQSRRLRIPDVGYVSTEDVCSRLAAADLALVLHEDATQELREVPIPSAGECVVVVGPEGGISPAELEAFKAAGSRIVRVSDAVLRTSTAGVVAISQLRALRP
ncbi:16S rRNA (uracil(1498)-N(3))-methyltransferase [Propionibacterium sp.]|uniref:16S rRNA (uracil(1498)-N(3))-methyltransferase n=1 Tax=Propionibacterium sp. TaxID=1977903 RepID=UPI0039EC9852